MLFRFRNKKLEDFSRDFAVCRQGLVRNFYDGRRCF